MQGMQGMQGIERAQGMQGIQRIQMMQGMQGIQRIQRIQRRQGMQRIQRMQRRQGIQRMQRIQRMQGIQRMQRMQGIKRIVAGEYRIQRQRLMQVQKINAGMQSGNSGRQTKQSYNGRAGGQKKILPGGKDFVDVWLVGYLAYATLRISRITVTFT